MTEKKLSEIFQSYFKTWFYIETEVSPVGSRLRIDLVLTSKINKDFVFGVELKKDGHKQGTHLVSLLKQAQTYSLMNFNIRDFHRSIPILIAPSISGMFEQRDKTHGEFHLHHNLNAIISHFNVGEIRKVYPSHECNGNLGYGFIFKNQLLWHEHNNHHKKNYKKYFKYDSNKR